MADYYKVLSEYLKNGDVIRRTSLQSGRDALYQDGKLIYGEDGDYDIEEIIKPEVHLVLFGAGHIAKALYDISRIAGMRITVIDEREEILNEERFPDAERIVMPFKEVFSSEFSFYRPYFVILTHGHAYDKDALRYVLKQKSSYIGMIGSRGKAASTKADLLDEGFTEKMLDEVHAPIGIKIGAQTPEEIAISILAEIISIYRKDKNLVNISPSYISSVIGKSGVSVRIIEKRGSAPRAVGSELFVADDKVYGTIGGGAIEWHAEKIARTLIKEKKEFLIEGHSLSSKGDLGMICGGDVTLLYQIRSA